MGYQALAERLEKLEGRNLTITEAVISLLYAAEDVAEELYMLRIGDLEK